MASQTESEYVRASETLLCSERTAVRGSNLFTGGDGEAATLVSFSVLSFVVVALAFLVGLDVDGCCEDLGAINEPEVVRLQVVTASTVTTATRV